MMSKSPLDLALCLITLLACLAVFLCALMVATTFMMTQLHPPQKS